MRKHLVALCLALPLLTACGAIGEAIAKAEANAKLPPELVGTWRSDGTLKQVLTISAQDFTLEVYSREGKLWQVYRGPMRNVANDVRFIGPAIQTLTQDDKDMSHLLSKGGPFHKLIYYADVTADAASFYIHNGYTDAKGLHQYDAEAKAVDRKYEKFAKQK